MSKYLRFIVPKFKQCWRLMAMLLNIGLWLISLRGGEGIMVAIYVALIIAGRRTYESVPAILKPAVKEDLEALGLGTDGKPLAA